MAELKVLSVDGTAICAQRFGAGPPLVLLSGALFASKLWGRVVSLLAGERELYVVDRRGRGKSGNVAPYAPEREIEDVLAVLAGIPGSVDLLGHSSGALLALQAAARLPQNLRRLVLYEPPVFFSQADRIPQDLPERLDELLLRGQLEAAVETFFREGPRALDGELQRMKKGPAWSHMVSTLAQTVPYDARVQRSFPADLEQLALIAIPTLMLVGEGSPQRMRVAAETVAARLPNARLHELAGQEHVAMLLAPALFAAALREFWSAAE